MRTRFRSVFRSLFYICQPNGWCSVPEREHCTTEDQGQNDAPADPVKFHFESTLKRSRSRDGAVDKEFDDNATKLTHKAPSATFTSTTVSFSNTSLPALPSDEEIEEDNEHDFIDIATIMSGSTSDNNAAAPTTEQLLRINVELNQRLIAMEQKMAAAERSAAVSDSSAARMDAIEQKLNRLMSILDGSSKTTNVSASTSGGPSTSNLVASAPASTGNQGLSVSNQNQQTAPSTSNDVQMETNTGVSLTGPSAPIHIDMERMLGYLAEELPYSNLTNQQKRDATAIMTMVKGIGPVASSIDSRVLFQYQKQLAYYAALISQGPAMANHLVACMVADHDGFIRPAVPSMQQARQSSFARPPFRGPRRGRSSRGRGK